MYPSKFVELKEGEVASIYEALFRGKDYIIIPFCDPRSVLGEALANVRSMIALNERTGDNIDVVYVDPGRHEKYREFVQFVHLMARQEVRDNFLCNFIMLTSRHNYDFMATYNVEAFSTKELEKFLFSLIEFLRSIKFPMSLEVENKLYDYGLPFRGRIWLRDFIRENKDIVIPLLGEIFIGKND